MERAGEEGRPSWLDGRFGRHSSDSSETNSNDGRSHDSQLVIRFPNRNGKPMITLQGTLDTLLPIKADSNVYRELTKGAGEASAPHRYYKIGDGDHEESFYDRYPGRLRQILPFHRMAFGMLERWIEAGRRPPTSRFVPRPESEDVVNTCRIDAR